MTKLELGTKRICGNCNVKFYDLHKAHIVCPKCDTVFVPPPVKAERPARAMRSAGVAAPSDAPKPAPLDEGTEASDQSAVKLKDESDGFAVLEREDEDDDAAGADPDAADADDDSIEKTDDI
jgi:uncharacterized protein (TIGR02300 family)